MTRTSSSRRGLSMCVKYIAVLALSLSTWKWERWQYRTKFGPLEWPGSKSDWMIWSPSRLHMQCAPTSRTSGLIWTESLRPGGSMCQNPSERTTRTMIRTGKSSITRRTSRSSLPAMSCSVSNCTNNILRRRLNFCARAVSMRYLALHTSLDFCSDLCGRCSEQGYWSLPSLAGRFCNQVKNPHCRSKSANFELPQGSLRLVQIFQSLPGPDSGGRSSTRTWRLLPEVTRSTMAASSKTPVDVRVGELDGQPSPGAHQAHPSQLDKTANHFGQINQFETPKGINCMTATSPEQ